MGRDIRYRAGAVVAGLCLTTLAVLAVPAAAPAADPVSFKNHVSVILQNRCVACHKPGGEGFQASGLDLRSYEGLMKGTKHGPIVVPGDAFTSNLNVLVEGRAAKAIRMPHNQKPLSAHEIGVLKRWVDEGAKNN